MLWGFNRLPPEPFCRSVLEETKVGATYSETLNAMLPLCDYVIVICPLTPATKGMFGEKQFRLMKNSATIVNIARGKPTSGPCPQPAPIGRLRCFYAHSSESGLDTWLKV